MIKGEITLQIKDSSTGDLLQEIVQENVITESFYTKLATYWQTHCWVAITNMPLESSRFTYGLPIDGRSGATAILPSTRIPSIGQWCQFLPSTSSTPSMLQVTGRYTAPAIGTTRTISTVSLVSFIDRAMSGPNQEYDAYYLQTAGSDHYSVIAFSKLSAPCIQTDSQVIDVYYRVLFPNDSENGLPQPVFNDLIRRYATVSWTGFHHRSVISPFKFPTIKEYDTGKIVFCKKAFAHDYSISAKINMFPASTINSARNRTISTTNPGFGDMAGILFRSMLNANEVLPYTFTNFDGFSKIQNVIAQGAESSVATASNWLDVDNLPSANGKIVISGDWQNTDSSISPGLYYSAKLPEYVKVNITNSGSVGEAKYKISRQKTLGTYESTLSKNHYTSHVIYPLCSDEIYHDGVTNQQTSFSNKTLLGESNETVFNGIHMSICQKYDDASFIIAKSNEIILYNLAAGDYWRFTSSFTNIRQLAVANDKIYVACRDTGLYVIDPKNSLNVTKIASTQAIDFSVCYGVATGYNSKIWVVATNGLVCLDGSSWIKYDENSQPAFVMPGVSNNLWSNIEYLVVDKESLNDNMLLVRKYDASQDAGVLGIWWSTTTAAVNSGAEPQSTATERGRPRIIRNHIGVLNGFWSLLSKNVYRIMSFGQTTFTASPINFESGNSTAGRRAMNAFQSVIFRKNLNNLPVQVAFNGSTDGWLGGYTADNSGSMVMIPHIKLLNSAGTISESLTTNHGLVLRYPFFSNRKAGDYSDWDSNPTEVLNANYSQIKTTSYGTYGGAFDQSSFFELVPGLIISIFRDWKINPPWPDSNYYGFSGVAVQAFMYGLDNTPSGGALKWIAQEEYGWDGSAWKIENAQAKNTHSSAEPLFDGINISFQSGTEFASPNVYKFGLTEGLLKDNATRFTLKNTPFYTKRLFKNQTSLSSNNVPAISQLQTGVTTYDPYRCSAGVSIDASSQIVFPGRNARQYAIHDKELTGDFIVRYSVTNLNTDEIKLGSQFGICRHETSNSGQISFGFITSNGSLQTIDNGNISHLTTDIAGITSLEIRRTGSSISLYRNGSIVRTMSSGAIRPFDLRLCLMSGTNDHRDVSLLPSAGTKSPATNIIQNGSDMAVYMGDPVQRSGAFHPKFSGIDATTVSGLSVSLNGIPAIVKIDGTPPTAGQVTVDIVKGIIYLNEADEGKSISAVYSYQIS